MNCCGGSNGSRRPATQRAIWGFSTVPPTADAAIEFGEHRASAGRHPRRRAAGDRQPLDGATSGDGYRLMVQAFVEYGARARLATWRIDVETDGRRRWRIADQERLTSVENLYRLSLNPTKQFDAKDVTIAAEDLDLTLAEGSIFVADTDQGVTGLVLLGRGEMRFHPKPETERGQLKIFCGAETLESRFDAAFIRINPGDVDRLVAADHITARAVDPRELRRADAVFREESPKSFGLELGELSRETWSMLPSDGDFLAEIRTRRFDTLTYARLAAQPEDINLFERKKRRNISLYSSEENLARAGPLLQRRRSGGLRRSRLRHRSRGFTRAAMDRRPRERAPEGAVARDQHDYAAACRFARRALDRQRPIRRSVRPPR